MNLSQIDALHHLVEGLVERMKAKHQLIAQADQAIEQAIRAKHEVEASASKWRTPKPEDQQAKLQRAGQVYEQAMQQRHEARRYLDEHGSKADRLFALYDRLRAEAIDTVLDKGLPGDAAPAAKDDLDAMVAKVRAMIAEIGSKPSS